VTSRRVILIGTNEVEGVLAAGVVDANRLASGKKIVD
jgi:hypothetical protein